MTWEYRGLKGVTRGYKGFQGVTGGDKWLQGVTNDNRNYLLTRTFPDTFSWSMPMPILWVFESDVFVVQKGLFPI